MPTLNQKGVVHIALILLLLAGLVAGVYLVQQQQIFRPKASGEKVWLIDESNNNLPQKDGGVYEVPGQEIRIFIHQPTVWLPPRPQGRLPNLVPAAYAQQSGQCGNTWSGQPTQCADSSGKTAGGTQCSGSYLGSYTGCSGNTLYCYSCPGATAPSGASSGTICVTNSFSGQPTQCADSSGKTSAGAQCSTYLGTYTGCSGNTLYCYTGCPSGGNATTGQTGGQTGSPDASTPKITGSVTWGAGNTIGIPGQDFGSGGTVYYSPGSQQTAFSKDQVSWSSSLIRINTDLIPECTAVKTVDCLIKGGYVKVCRTDSKCSDFARIPDRTIESGSPQGAVHIPNAPKGEVQPEVAEATQEIRISSVEDYVKKDGACEGSEDPAKHCMKFTADHPDQRYTFAALVTKEYVDWWLANTTEEQNVYVGFISNKGTNYTESIKVRIVRPQPTAKPTPAGGGAPPPFAKTTLDTLAGSPDVSCISGAAYQYPLGSDRVDTGYGCVCKENDRDRMVVFITDKETGQDLVETGSSCTAPAAASPAPSPKPSCPIEGACVNESGKTVGNLTCDGTDESNTYSCSNPAYPTCLTGVSCKPSTITGGEGRGGLRRDEGEPSGVRPSCLQSDGTCVNEFSRTRLRDICTRGTGRSNDYDCPPEYPTCIFGADCRAVPTPAPAGAGSLDQPVAGTIKVQNNTGKQVTVQKVKVEVSYGVDWFIQLFPDDELLNNKPIDLDPNQSTALQATSRICSADDVKQGKEKVVKVEYTDTAVIDPTLGSIPREARGKYQCGGSGSVIIP